MASTIDVRDTSIGRHGILVNDESSLYIYLHGARMCDGVVNFGSIGSHAGRERLCEGTRGHIVGLVLDCLHGIRRHD
jgi:hypothetical protein